MMGVGNLTELTDVDSAGRQHAAVGFCQELGDPERADDGRDQLGAVVGPRDRPGPAAGSSCRDAPDACPSTSSPAWSCSATPRSPRFGPENLAELQRRIRDPNWRIFAEDGQIHALNNTHFLRDTDPFLLFDQMGVDRPVARVLPRLRADEGENRLDSEQDLSAGSGAGVGLPDRARGEPPRPPRATRTAQLSRAEPETRRAEAERGRRDETARDPRRDRHDAEPRGRAEHRADGPGGRRRTWAWSGSCCARTAPRRPTGTSRRGARASSTSPTTSCCWPRRRSASRSTRRRDLRPAEVVAGRILAGACRYYEFRVVELDDRDDRTRIARRDRRRGPAPRLLRLQPRQARRGRGGDPGHADGLPAPRRDPGRVREAGRPRRQDRRPGRGRGLPPPARARPAMRLEAELDLRPRHAHDRDSHSHPNPEPSPLRPAGLGAQARPAVRRRRPDDRGARASS